jgi:hypothetical protein
VHPNLNKAAATSANVDVAVTAESVRAVKVSLGLLVTNQALLAQFLNALKLGIRAATLGSGKGEGRKGENKNRFGEHVESLGGVAALVVR